jgi:hypothetical protein
MTPSELWSRSQDPGTTIHPVREIQTAWSGREMRMFFALQLGDIITTILFVSRGIAETNPLASYLMDHFGLLPGLLILKGGAIAIALICGAAAHPRFIRGFNILYVFIVLMNILTLCTVPAPAG